MVPSHGANQQKALPGQLVNRKYRGFCATNIGAFFAWDETGIRACERHRIEFFKRKDPDDIS